jgi:hypothetical protein
MSQFTATTTVPLAAGQQFTSAWFATDPNFPYVEIQAASDVYGQLQLYESDILPGSTTVAPPPYNPQVQAANPNDGSANIVGGITVVGGQTGGVLTQPIPTGAVGLQGLIRAQFWRIVYTNGAVNQTVFSLTLASSSYPINVSNARILDLILRELRAQSVLLTNLIGDDGLEVDLPFALDDVTQGIIFPGAPAIAAIPPIPAVPSFS